MQVYSAMCRATGRLPEAIVTGVVSGIAAVVSAALAAEPFGLAGMAWAWVAIQYVIGAWALVRVRTLRVNIVDPLVTAPGVNAPMAHTTAAPR